MASNRVATLKQTFGRDFEGNRLLLTANPVYHPGGDPFDQKRAMESRGEGGNGELVKVSRMKPCVCNGTNENCCRCSGSGYVLDSGSPPVDPELLKWIPESQVEKEPRPYVTSPARMHREDWIEYIGELVVGLLTLLFILYLLWRAISDAFAK